MRYGMVIDLDKCIGCQTCAVVCHMHNAQPPGTWWNRVFTQGAEYHESAVGKDGNYKIEFLPLSCQMCENPACEKVCPTGATYTNEQGVVLVDYNRCIGCRTCMAACPYGVRQFNWQNAKKAKKDLGYDYGYPHDATEKPNRLVYTQNRPTGVVEKCTFCAQYVQNGELPACVRACPGKARFFGDLDDPKSEVNQLISKKQVHRLREDYGTAPKVYYISSSKTKNIEEAAK
ncbi:MAG: 4Fe-4S dicluster domain-containing protein [Lachnospiraceae bacterium]|jgi:molybdopterin-containing oxidoreductase family iron-sulfur binding subunit|uniref:4Fe-4S dicluster domain-containing protein n=1 Tax=Clostridium sp. (strain SY8519) TaxID=1042156 RepID=UPI000217223E|nr:4Fe-4S dicluster domain-containing protein [Clostridium sp. SY8519]MCI1654330.1 4Fe-4S dicluster domain-containing protein [Lachnospiraceae bacterium]MCI1656706.1 4Fe-4S dicluster domain-containing protein [Lachnospiraceae bacterium]MCI2195286.1 4Fe-4S dicluster domain-containing protein [Lachnospiraceae bacterium]BAK48362.1 Fe-S-cluster-containing hydrogenase component 1 [Clostridium sp. SY8519]HAD19922.1 4Fe-4S dicluster domain-containing protein [Lachnospiraceae bacterium]